MTMDTKMWSSAAWREEAVTWLDERLAAAGIERTGTVEQARMRPWGTVLTASTTRGPVWFKAAGAGTAFEAGLYEILQRVAPDCVLEPIAFDVPRGWMVLPDGGEPLAQRVDGADLVDALATIMPRYGRLQRELAPRVDDLLALGVADMRPAVMPARFGEALEAVGRYVARHGDAADRETHEHATALTDTFAAWCDRLSQAPGAPSLDHNDLHPYNILVDRGGEARFYDWGDSVIAHPFACMLQPLGWVARQLGFGVDSPEVARVRDAYLDVFDDLAPHAELVEALELACHVGKAARALTWDRAVRALGDGEHADAPLQSVRALLDDSYLGGA